MTVISNDSPTQVSSPHLIQCFALSSSQTKLLTKNDFCDYDVIIASLHRKLHMLYNVDYFLAVYSVLGVLFPNL